MIEIRRTDPAEPAIRALIEQLDEYQADLYPAESNHLDAIVELQRDHVYFFAAYEGDQVLGCGAVKFFPDYGEIKRMFVSPPARGRGLGVKLLQALERQAEELTVRVLRLETGHLQDAAIRLYQNSGYKEIGPFGQYSEDPHSVFMEKCPTAT